MFQNAKPPGGYPAAAEKFDQAGEPIASTHNPADSADQENDLPVILDRRLRAAEIDIAKIRVGKRHRKDLGDIATFAAQIDELGELLQPITIRPDGLLVAGERRLRAFQMLGRKQIPARVSGVDDILKAELAENMHRKDFTPSEAVSIRRALESKMKAAAKERQGKRTDKHPGNLPESSKGDSRDKTAAFTGYAARTLDKADAVVAAAEADPEKFGKLLADMDRTGRVDGPYKRLKVMRQAEAIRKEPPPLPSRGPYRVIVADPPWPYEIRKEDPSHRATHPYPQMSIASICALDVRSIAHDDCILWLWVTNHHLREAFAVLDAWGFDSKTMLTWAKDSLGYGDWLRGRTEHCLMATRGRPTVTLTNQTTLLTAPKRANSEKPEEFFELVERLCPAPRYAELFSRHPRENWDVHGDESDGLASWKLGISELRKRGVIEGRFEPVSDDERRLVEEARP